MLVCLFNEATPFKRVRAKPARLVVVTQDNLAFVREDDRDAGDDLIGFSERRRAVARTLKLHKWRCHGVPTTRPNHVMTTETVDLDS